MTTTSSGHVNSQVFHLASWPPVSQLPQENASNITRICALLARRPSVGMLIPLMLNMPEPVIYSLLETLHASGHIYIARSPLPAPLAVPDAEPAQTHEPVVMSFLAKLWQRLIGDENV